MQILSQREAIEQRNKKYYIHQIQRICRAYEKGKADLVTGRGYLNDFKRRAEDSAYDIGWNEMAERF